MVLVGIAILSLAFLGVALVAICLHDLGLINPELELMGIVLVPILLILLILSSPQLQNGNVWVYASCSVVILMPYAWQQ